MQRLAPGVGAEHCPAQNAHRQLLASKVRSFIDFLDGYFGEPPYWDRFG